MVLFCLIGRMRQACPVSPLFPLSWSPQRVYSWPQGGQLPALYQRRCEVLPQVQVQRLQEARNPQTGRRSGAVAQQPVLNMLERAACALVASLSLSRVLCVCVCWGGWG